MYILKVTIKRILYVQGKNLHIIIDATCKWDKIWDGDYYKLISIHNCDCGVWFFKLNDS